MFLFALFEIFCKFDMEKCREVMDRWNACVERNGGKAMIHKR
jgi:hypothetical protein